jgi:hypothetical protein
MRSQPQTNVVRIFLVLRMLETLSFSIRTVNLNVRMILYDCKSTDKFVLYLFHDPIFYILKTLKSFKPLL